MRRVYRESKDRLGISCPVSGYPIDEVHEIPRGTGCRHLAVRDIDACLPVSRVGHEKLGDYSEYPLERQVALKCVLVMKTVDACREGLRRLDREEVLRWLNVELGNN